jgi:hypothetical protein
MIDYGIEIPNKIICLPNSLYVEKIEYGERKTKSGLVINKESMDHYGNFARPRWAKVKYKADNITNVEIGDWILIGHGNWSTSMLMIINGEKTYLWYISPKSYKEGFMAISKTMPEELKEYGIEDE